MGRHAGGWSRAGVVMTALAGVVALVGACHNDAKTQAAKPESVAAAKKAKAARKAANDRAIDPLKTQLDHIAGPLEAVDAAIVDKKMDPDSKAALGAEHVYAYTVTVKPQADDKTEKADGHGPEAAAGADAKVKKKKADPKALSLTVLAFAYGSPTDAAKAVQKVASWANGVQLVHHGEATTGSRWVLMVGATNKQPMTPELRKAMNKYMDAFMSVH